MLQAPVAELRGVLRLLSWGEHHLAGEVERLPGRDDLLQVRRGRVPVRPGAASAKIR